MSQENIEVVRCGYDAFSRGELAAMFEDVHPEIVSYTTPPLPDPGEHSGYDGMLEWISDWTAEFDDFTMEAEEFIEGSASTTRSATHSRPLGCRATD
jgi:ketosteroid isomerase-like protein